MSLVVVVELFVCCRVTWLYCCSLFVVVRVVLFSVGAALLWLDFRCCFLLGMQLLRSVCVFVVLR